jgi:uncharacterized protein (TIGR02594 family)
MPAATRLGDECTGHGCFPPRINDQGSENVFVNGIASHRSGDHWTTHCCGPACHDSIASESPSTVFINGKPAVRIGDGIECGSIVAQGSPSVFFGEYTSTPVDMTDAAPFVVYKVTVTTTVAAPAPNLVDLTPAQTAGIASSSAAANSPAEAEVGLTGKGEVPQEGTPAEIPAEQSPVTGDSIFAKLAHVIDSCMAQSKNGEWKETGSNPNIIACFKAAGSSNTNDRKVPWCAAYATNALKLAGAPAKATLSSLAYKGYGTSIDINDKSKWRLNDVIIFTRKGGGHIGFFRGYNPSNGSVLVVGGNQSDNLTEKAFKNNSEMPVVYIGRAWDVPAEYDKPVTYTGSGGSVKVV